MSSSESEIRRSKRVRREKPKGHDMVNYGKDKDGRQGKNNRAFIKKTRNSNVDTKLEMKGVCMKTKRKKVEEPKEEGLEEAVLPQETLAKFALILDEINRKICASSWRA